MGVIKLLERIAGWLKKEIRERRVAFATYTCPACKYYGLVYLDDETAECALCGIRIRGREEIQRLKDRAKTIR